MTAGPAFEDAGRSQPVIPVPVVNGNGRNGPTPETCPERAEADALSGAQRVLFMTAMSSRVADRSRPRRALARGTQ